ncbi:MAG: ArsR family transcriptional regulator [Candidatus Thorarchaeota archaeon]
MTEHIDDIKKELEEVRKLKEELRREVEDARREKEEVIRKKVSEFRGSKIPRPPRPPREPRPVRPVRPVKIDIAGITDSLEDMMDDLGRSIEMSIKDFDGIAKDFKMPGVRIRTGGRRGKSARRKDIEAITPERIAKIVAPLGSEERLGILDYLKGGGKTFNEIENFTEKTGSSLTHHLNPLVEAGYVVKGEVRGTYYVTVEGRLAYRLAQWLTHRVEQQREQTGNNGDAHVDIEFDESSNDEDDTVVIENEEDLEDAAEHLERVAEQIERAQDQIEEVSDKIEEAQDALEEAEELDEDEDDDDDDEEDLDNLDWDD